MADDHFLHIYQNHADLYDWLIQCEDYQGNILPALQAIRSLDGLDVVEFGAGTGRLTRLLAPLVSSIQAFDASLHMLQIANSNLHSMGITNWQTTTAMNAAIPIKDNVADLAIEGWSFGHTMFWQRDTWRQEIDQTLAEIRRVLRPGGTVILLETLGTGHETPHIPNEELARLYTYWEQECAFKRSWIRTDYRFESLSVADELTRFFFGNELADRVVSERLMILPECTGIWSLTT
jgi:ubiquinone/menaquinone biosynthesis C-methylase UbiE